MQEKEVSRLLSTQVMRRIGSRTSRQIAHSLKRIPERFARQNPAASKQLGSIVLDRLCSYGQNAGERYMLVETPGLAHYGRRRIEGEQPCPFLDMRNGHEGRFAVIALRQHDTAHKAASLTVYEDMTKSMQDIFVRTAYEIQPDGVVSHRRSPIKLKFSDRGLPTDGERVLTEYSQVKKLSEFVATAHIITSDVQMERSLKHFQQRIDQYATPTIEPGLTVELPEARS